MQHIIKDAENKVNVSNTGKDLTFAPDVRKLIIYYKEKSVQHAHF